MSETWHVRTKDGLIHRAEPVRHGADIGIDEEFVRITHAAGSAKTLFYTSRVVRVRHADILNDPITCLECLAIEEDRG